MKNRKTAEIHNMCNILHWKQAFLTVTPTYAFLSFEHMFAQLSNVRSIRKHCRNPNKHVSKHEDDLHDKDENGTNILETHQEIRMSIDLGVVQ